MDHYDTDRVGTILFSGMAKEESSTNSDSSLSPLLSEDLQSSGDTDEEDESNSNGETSDNENDQSYSSKMTNLHPEKQSTHTGKEETTKDRGSRLHSIQIPKINTKMLRSGYSEQEATVKTEFPKPHGTKRKKAISKRALRRRITKLNELRRKSKDRERALEERVVEVEGEKAILEKEKREMAMNFGKAQEHSMNQWKKQEVDVMPDDIVRIKFQDLIGKCRNCLNKPYFVKSVDDWPKISSLVMNMLSAKQGGKTWTSGRFSAAVAAGKVSIRTILMAKMSRMLREILDDHFFWLQPRKDEQVSKNAGATLQWVEDLGRKVSEEEASSWRSQTLRIIDPPESKKPESDADIYRLARKEKAYEVYADRFLSTCDVFLNDLDSDAALKLRTELMSLNRMLGDLCAKLYAQNVRIRVLASRKDFAEFGGTTFSVDSKLMLAHGSLNIHDNDDHSKDGWPLDLIVQPAIIAYHNKRAESDNEYSVWLQGVVWTAGKRGPLIGEAKNSISAEPATGQKHSSNANTESSRRQCIWIDLSSTKDRRESECTSPRCPDGMPQFLAAKVKTTSDEAPGITSSPSEMANHCQPRPGTPKSARPDATTSSMHPAKVDAASGSKRHQSPEEQESVAGSKKKKVTAGGHDPSHANP